ncbi:hypothetical protein [Bradyrhizobium manausense]|uniref:Uncharacterized protein n=1 Tax=Bradyrhizobium manausense TaxID=989370 RepID=A0A0R3DZI4_9BRAD|nr:hypothetical protein [Bradyrhizobium manausense]KRQ15363.1 hypothetical protein AOQ71_10205 [Bradyrhizobium manausense]
MTNGLGLFDEYNRQARLFPALLALLPPLLALLAWFPNLLLSNLGSTLLTLLCSCGILFALAVFSRATGKNVEKRLLKEWGGWRTTLWLRHSDISLVAPTKQRYHQALARHVPNLKLPTAVQEQNDQAGADAVYASAVEWLKEYCRKGKYPLVQKENIEYGFRRNMRGVRPFAIAVTAVALVLSIGAMIREISISSAGMTAALQSLPIVVWGSTLLLLIALGAWMIAVTDAWVREGGDQYARALLATCEGL